MRVLLVYPACLEARAFEENVTAPPMGLFWVAAALERDGHGVEILNGHELGPDPDAAARAFENLVHEHAPGVIGFSVLQANRFQALDLARAAKRADPAPLTVFGGPSATFLWEHFLAHHPEVDAVAVGEGEAVMAELCRTLDQGRDWTGLHGLAVRAPDGRPALNPPAAPIEDLDSLPIPAGRWTYRHLSLTRGCPGKCRFCGSPRFWGAKVRSRSAKRFVDEMEMLAERGQRFLFVSDDTFTVRRKTALAVCAEIEARGLDIVWQAISRVDYVDPELLRAMRRAGCIQISYGVESGSERIRRALGKKTPDQAIDRAFALTRAAGILPRAYFIYGSPGEDDESVRASLECMARIRPLAALFHVLVAFPGAGLWEDVQERTGLTDDHWLTPVEDVMWFEADPAISVEDMRRWRDELHRAFAEGLPGWARSVADELDPDPDMAGLHADFLSRLGMTFLEGEHAETAGPEGPVLARELFERSLGFAPDARALLGLGLMAGRSGDLEEAAGLFERGLERFPEHAGLRRGLASALSGLGRRN